MNPSPVFIYCPICKKVQKQKPRSQMRRTHLASCLAEEKRFELLRRQNRPTGFLIRTLQPLGYTSMYWKSVSRFTTYYSLFSKNCVHPMSVLCFWGLFPKPETPCSTKNYRFYRTFFSSHSEPSRLEPFQCRCKNKRIYYATNSRLWQGGFPFPQKYFLRSLCFSLQKTA